MGLFSKIKRSVKKTANTVKKTAISQAKKRGRKILKKAVIAGAATGAGFVGGPVAAGLIAKTTQEVLK